MFETKTKKVNTDELKFGESGLVCVIAQDYESGEVLLQSYMNRECVDKTFASGYVYYYDPASGLPRKKGEASGNTQKVVTAFLDDDKDCLLLKVRQKGFACHTGTYTCFAEQIKGEDNEIGGVLLEASFSALWKKEKRTPKKGPIQAFCLPAASTRSPRRRGKRRWSLSSRPKTTTIPKWSRKRRISSII